MKQVSYNFDWNALAQALVTRAAYFYGIDDGFWQIGLTTESVTSSFPAPVDGAVKMVLPGHLIRITGIQLTKVPKLGFMCVEVSAGKVIDVNTTSNTNQHGPEAGSGPTGENSGPAREMFMSPIAAGFQ